MCPFGRPTNQTGPPINLCLRSCAMSCFALGRRLDPGLGIRPEYGHMSAVSGRNAGGRNDHNTNIRNEKARGGDQPATPAHFGLSSMACLLAAARGRIARTAQV